MAFARDTFTATPAQTDFTMTFPYLDTSDVLVYVDAVLQTEGATNDYTIVSTSIVRFNSGLTGGETVLILRSTSRNTRLVDYATASTLTEEDMDNDSLQAFYMAQEAIDTAEASGIVADLSDQWDFLNKQSVNVPIPTVSTGVASKAYVDSVTSVAGNVPTPADPGDDTKVLTASGGTFTWDNFYSGLATWAQDFLQDTTVAAARTELGLGSVALQNNIDGTDIVIGSDAHGDILYRGASNYERLAAGTAGTRLTSGGAGAAPTWEADPFSGQFLSVSHVLAQNTNGGGYTAGSFQTCYMNTEDANDLTGSGMIWQLPYDNQTGNFNVGNTLTGLTSGATAIIVGDTDAGTTGTLEVINITNGPFTDGEVLSDGGGGSADANIPSGVTEDNSVWLVAGDWYVECDQQTFGCGMGVLRVYDVTNTAQLLQGIMESDSGYAGSSDVRRLHGRITVPGGGAKVEVQFRAVSTRSTNAMGIPANLSGVSEKYNQFDFWKVS